MPSSIPKTGTRSTLDPELKQFLQDNPKLHLGGDGDFHAERRHHTQVFGFHKLDPSLWSSESLVEHTAVRGPHGTVYIRLFYPSRPGAAKGELGALVYMHGGGYTVGSVDEFENGLRIIAEHSGAITIGVEYHLAPEHRFPTQLDEYEAVLAWTRSKEEGGERGIHPDKVCGGGDSAGGNMTAALALRLMDQGKKQMAAQFLLYPEARVPFDTPAAEENNTGLYLECNGIFSFADHYLPRGVPPSNRYVSPGMQSVEKLAGVPPAFVYTCGFDPLRDVGVEYASKLDEAGNKVKWRHYEDLTHGFLQFAPWSKRAMEAAKTVASDLRSTVYN